MMFFLSIETYRSGKLFYPTPAGKRPLCRLSGLCVVLKWCSCGQCDCSFKCAVFFLMWFSIEKHFETQELSYNLSGDTFTNLMFAIKLVVICGIYGLVPVQLEEGRGFYCWLNFRTLNNFSKKKHKLDVYNKR